jgi:hypothetical protein
MDFNTFVITGPNTLTQSVGYEIGGSFSYAAGVAYNLATLCQTDTFSITGDAGGTPPVICGTNSGYHGKCWLYWTIFITIPTKSQTVRSIDKKLLSGVFFESEIYPFETQIDRMKRLQGKRL